MLNKYLLTQKIFSLKLNLKHLKRAPIIRSPSLKLRRSTHPSAPKSPAGSDRQSLPILTIAHYIDTALQYLLRYFQIAREGVTQLISTVSEAHRHSAYSFANLRAQIYVVLPVRVYTPRACARYFRRCLTSNVKRSSLYLRALYVLKIRR